MRQDYSRLNRRQAIASLSAFGLALPVRGAAQDYLAPGVYVEELPLGARAIKAAETSVAAFVGPLGPDAGVAEPFTIKSLDDVRDRLSGSKDCAAFLHTLIGFFENGGKEAVIAPCGGAVEEHEKALWLLENSDLTFNLLYLTDAARIATANSTMGAVLYAKATSLAKVNGAMLLVDGEADPASAVGWRADLGLVDPDIAAYAPGLLFPGCDANEIGAGGAVAGMIARTDADQGVWKAPAGLEAEIRGAQPARSLSTGDMMLMVQSGVNPVSVFSPDANPLVWGSRTMSSDPEWRYVPVRRYYRFLERTIGSGTDWVVFEPNDEPLWRTVRSVVAGFMSEQFRQGAFAGPKPSEAFFVRCGLGETMTQADIDNGRLIINLGFAPLQPAEFVVLTLEKTMSL